MSLLYPVIFFIDQPQTLTLTDYCIREDDLSIFFFELKLSAKDRLIKKKLKSKISECEQHGKKKTLQQQPLSLKMYFLKDKIQAIHGF